MQDDFDADTAVESKGNGLYTGEAREAWWVGSGPNGGYIAAMIMRALEAEMARTAPGAWTPRSLTIHFLRPLALGPCQIQTTLERSGRSLATLSVRVRQDEVPYALGLAAFALPRTSQTFSEAMPPACPAPEQCVELVLGAEAPIFTGKYFYRWGIGDPPFSGSAHARVGGWISLRQPVVPGMPLVAALTDAWMPCIFPRLAGPITAPTVDLTIHFRTAALPTRAPDAWYLAAFSSSLGAEGFFEEDGEVWSQNGVLLAQSRQLALLPEE
jgi:acyl-CoA thioesterase